MILGIFWAPLVYSIVVNTMLAIGVSYLASLMMKKPKQFSPDIGNYPQQTAMKGLPIQKVYGKRRVAGNILQMKDLGEFDIGGGIKVKKASYLIGICEGPAVVLKYWLGPTLQAGGRKFYFFDGDGTTGWWMKGGTRVDMGVTVRDLTGEEFGDYENNICCCFVQDHLCNMDGSPPEFTFEVKSGYSDFGYYAGCQWGGGVDQRIVWKISRNNTLDTAWADGGAWHFTSAWSSTTHCYDLYQMPDGRLLILHNDIWIEGGFLPTGKLISCTMLTTEGEIDTSWGHNGHYVIVELGVAYSYSGSAAKLIRDKYGHFHLFGQSNFGSIYNYHIFDENGTRLYVYDWGTHKHPMIFYDAVLSADGDTIIAVGSASTSPGANQYNVIAFNVTDGSVKTDWGGNISENGYAAVGYAGTITHAYSIERAGSGYVVAFGITVAGDNSLAKLTENGATDTAWGTAGYNIAGYFANYEKRAMTTMEGRICTLGWYHSGGVTDNTIQWLRVWDSAGRLADSKTFTSAFADVYTGIIINSDSLILSTIAAAPATYKIERWSLDLNFRNGISPVGYPTVTNVMIPIATQLPDITDANPSDIVKDLATNTRYGAGLSFDYIDGPSFASVAGYCDDNDILISPVIKDSKPVVDYIDQILAHCNGYRFWGGGKLKLGVFKDEEAVDPPITQDDLVVEGDEEPVTVAPRKRSETFNRIRVGWSNRVNNYDFSSEIAEDQVDQKVGNEVRIREVDLSGICRIELARKIAQRGLFESMYRYNFFTFRVGYKHSLMEVGDVKLLSDGGQIVNQKIRILSIREEKDGRTLAVEAIEEAAGLYLSTTYDSQLAWTPQALYPTDEVELTDAATITVTPITSIVSDTVDLNDYAHLEII